MKMRKKKRREASPITTTTTTTSLIKSSSQRSTINLENHKQTSIGCMSGIFSLLSKYHQRRKLLTSGDKNANSTCAKHLQSRPDHLESELRRFSCEIKRSPTITSDIRRSEVRNADEDVVAKLIGGSEQEYSVMEKRRKLMDSLQKCEEDLNSLKMIIEAVRSTDHLYSSTPAAADTPPPEITNRCLMVEVEGGYSNNSEQPQEPSPVSVLESVSPSSSLVYNRFIVPTNGCADLSFLHKITREASPRLSNQRDDNQCGYLSLARMKTKINLTSPFWSNKAKAESINEVYQEAVWEERWELERIGVMLEDYIFRDLIEETVSELGCLHAYSLPFEACRRILHF